MRITRYKTPVIYDNDEEFKVGGSITFRDSKDDLVTLVCTGEMVHEGLKAYEELKKEGINIRIIDAYCVKPIDKKTILRAAKETKAIITVEDHYITGGLGDAVLEVLAENRSVPVYKMGVSKTPKSGKPKELLEYEEISARYIISKVKSVI